jgi:hypothetical protein
MKSDAFSRAILPAWMRISVVGLLISAAGAIVGSAVREALQGNASAVAITARVTAAGVSGLGIGFSALFVLLFVAGGLFQLLHRR